jgi:AcrR family transcriptional regulator
VTPAPAALLVAHPGHELRLFGWMERARPVVFVLTDGSGHLQQSRLASTTRVLERCGATPGSIYGRFTDGELYELILNGGMSRLCRLATELAEELAGLGIATVVGDGVEGYNPSHDLCQYLARAAARLAGRQTGRPIACYQFPVVGPPTDGDAGHDGRILTHLDAEALQRKLSAARAYPEMRDEVQEAVSRYGDGAFAVECLRNGDLRREEETMARKAPFYESHGEKQVAAGYYTAVIRYKEHFEPVARALDGLGR